MAPTADLPMSRPKDYDFGYCCVKLRGTSSRHRQWSSHWPGSYESAQGRLPSIEAQISEGAGELVG